MVCDYSCSDITEFICQTNAHSRIYVNYTFYIKVQNEGYQNSHTSLRFNTYFCHLTYESFNTEHIDVSEEIVVINTSL